MSLIVSLCDTTRRILEPWEAAGHECLNFDLRGGVDVRLLKHLGRKPFAVFAFPPCTHYSSSGARWWAEKGEAALLEANAILDACCRFILMHQPKIWFIENPVGRAKDYLGKSVLVCDPWEYAGWADDPASEAYTKATCLWGNFYPPEKKPVYPELGSAMWKLGPSEDRAYLRSVTPQGFSRAFYRRNYEHHRTN